VVKRTSDAETSILNGIHKCKKGMDKNFQILKKCHEQDSRESKNLQMHRLKIKSLGQIFEKEANIHAKVD